MHDPYNVYTREEAVRVGRALDDLNFYSFEDPLPTTDVDGLEDLCQALDVQVLVGEHVQGLGGYTEYIRQHAADAIRCQDVNLGGITPMLKVCHLAEAFGMKCEPHSWGNPFTQASNLNVILAVRNCDFFELPYPEGIFDRGFKDVIRIDSEGYVQAPRKSGIGLDIDWDFVHKNTIRGQRFPKT
jgi:L-alanine-DL-glutamate epimerase-like enolase superfamily enzyme